MTYTEKRLEEFDEKFCDKEKNKYGYLTLKDHIIRSEVADFLSESIHQARAEERERVENWKILRFCGRCGVNWCKLGKVLEYGKHYPAFTIKLADGTKKEYSEDTEIKKAVCTDCAKELFDSDLLSSLDPLTDK